MGAYVGHDDADCKDEHFDEGDFDGEEADEEKHDAHCDCDGGHDFDEHVNFLLQRAFWSCGSES